MEKLLSPLILLFLLFSSKVEAQYTEIINSNRPGHSQGSFSVGRDVLQLEGGPYYGRYNNKIKGLGTKDFGANYEVRYGWIWEELEINFKGNSLISSQEVSGGKNLRDSLSEFNTLGLKYLLYDPYKKRDQEEPNLYSWKDNHRFHWNVLIPAISIYAGANLPLGENKASPKVVLITQHNIRSFVFVMNFIADRLTDTHQRYAMIMTLTHTFNQRISAFAEFETIDDHFYSDDLFRLGGAYLLTPNLQFDLSGLINFKDTPSRWQINVGASYRFDFHKKNDRLFDKKK